MEDKKDVVLLTIWEAVQNFILDELVDPAAKIQLIHKLGEELEIKGIKTEIISHN